MIEGSARTPAIAAAVLFLSLSPMSPLSQELPRFPPVTPRGAGTVTPPEGGYVAPPEPASPGTVPSARIPSDEVDRAFWELYDRDKHVTLTGKVTAVNWTQPNVYIFVAASGEWAVEASFPQFRQASVTPAVQVGQTITVKGYLAKEAPLPRWTVKSSPSVASHLKAKRLIRAAELTTGYGQKIRLGRPLSEEEERAELLKCSRLGC
jgi:uncharacterized protein YdeI (BOF family)